MQKTKVHPDQHSVSSSNTNNTTASSNTNNTTASREKKKTSVYNPLIALGNMAIGKRNDSKIHFGGKKRRRTRQKKNRSNKRRTYRRK